MADRETEEGIGPLRDYLASLPPGSVADTARLEPILAECWNEFRGSGESGMHPGKLHGRMEEATWNPPLRRAPPRRARLGSGASLHRRSPGSPPLRRSRDAGEPGSLPDCAYLHTERGKPEVTLELFHLEHLE